MSRGRGFRAASNTLANIALSTALLCTFLAWPGTAAPALAPSPPPARGPAVAGPGETVVWVLFRDRGPISSLSPAERRELARAQVSARSLERRQRRGGGVGPLESDLPVHAGYVEDLERRGFRVRAISRWLNGASVVAPRARLAELRALPHVASVEPVPRGMRTPQPEIEGAPERGLAPSAEGIGSVAFDPGTPAFYGPSWAQNRLIQVDQLHAAGLSGAGVLVTVLDTGFREVNPALDSLDVIARRDFIQGDLVVANEAGDAGGQDGHGTSVLSLLAGRELGVLMGTGYGVTVALGKTESVSFELPVEMDFWQMGAEWADSLGADMISASLGYFIFDGGVGDYTYEDLDGNTTVVTRAADEAAARGITVVTAMGNEGNSAWGKLIAPADGDSVLAVGAVDSLGTIAGFSSFGPTADGQVKPDVCAMGVATWAASTTTAFGRIGGTSAATPLAAGLVALLLEAHPTWGPYEVLEALRSTAMRFGNPDMHYGYGLARGALAMDWVPSTVDTQPTGRGATLVAFGANPSRQGASSLRLRMGAEGGRARVSVFDARGRMVRALLDEELPPRSSRTVPWDGRDESGRRVPAGVYLALLSAPGSQDAERLVVLP